MSDFSDFMDEIITEEQATSVAQADLIPDGKYEGVLTRQELQVSDKAFFQDGKTNPLYGVKTARLTAELYNVEGKTRYFSFSVTGANVIGEGGKPVGATKFAVQLAKSTDKVGKALGEAIQAATETRLQYAIGNFNGKNVLRGIGPIRG